jgi:uncharacterized protein (TIGR02611 family)
MEPTPRRRRLVEGVRERRERHRERGRTVRAAVMLGGFALVLAGLVMLVLPGPGLLVIAIGLGVLALEFAWAERLLERTVDKMSAASDRVKKTSRAQQAILVLLALLVVVGAVAAAYAWDIPVLPV